MDDRRIISPERGSHFPHASFIARICPFKNKTFFNVEIFSFFPGEQGLTGTRFESWNHRAGGEAHSIIDDLPFQLSGRDYQLRSVLADPHGSAWNPETVSVRVRALLADYDVF